MSQTRNARHRHMYQFHITTITLQTNQPTTKCSGLGDGGGGRATKGIKWGHQCNPSTTTTSVILSIRQPEQERRRVNRCGKLKQSPRNTLRNLLNAWETGRNKMPAEHGQWERDGQNRQNPHLHCSNPILSCPDNSGNNSDPSTNKSYKTRGPEIFPVLDQSISQGYSGKLSIHSNDHHQCFRALAGAQRKSLNTILKICWILMKILAGN